MFLTLPRHEVQAVLGIGMPYGGKCLYDLSAERDKLVKREDSFGLRISTEIALVGIALISLVESVVRIPLSLLGSLLFAGGVKWFDGLGISILTIIFSVYSLFINLFVKNLSNYLVHLDINLRSIESESFLYQACETGNYDLAKTLLDRKVDPHKVHQTGITTTLIPRLEGQTHLEKLFPLNAYEDQFFKLKILSHWLGLHGSATLHDHEFSLEGAPSRWMFHTIGESFECFLTDNSFPNQSMTYENAVILQRALFSAYTEHSYENISKNIQNKKLTFVSTGWKQHGICLCFCDGYMAISNRGDGGRQTSTLNVSKIDRSLVTPEVVEEILMHQTLDAEVGKKYFYETLPAKLSGSGKIEKDSLCADFCKIAPKSSKTGVCALASKQGAMRFAWAMLISNPPTEASLKRTKQEMKLFTDWASCNYFKQYRDQFTDLIPKDSILKEAKVKSDKKHWRYNLYKYTLCLPSIITQRLS
ncbi:MAG: hypothetical protein K1000chlam2_01287 [Chlamydiae bacterium]|nr:hypothetical protein [Chlamydiota bacterium]